MNFILKWLVATLAIMMTGAIIPGVIVNNFWTALWLALALGLFNSVLRPLLIILTLPVNILTLGLFIFVINASLVLLAATIIKGFSVSGFWEALLFSIVLSVFSYVLNNLFRVKKIK